MQYDRSNVIGRGSYGVVYAGTFKGENVAVKQIHLMVSNLANNREVLNQQLLNHPNIVQFKDYQEDIDSG